MNPAAALAWALVVVGAAAALSFLSVALLRRAPVGSLVRSHALVTPLLLAAVAVSLSALEPPAPAWQADTTARDLSQWNEVHAVGADAVTVVDTPAPSGAPTSLRFEVEPGDRTFGQTEEERAEIMASAESSRASEGEEQWYGWWTLLPDPVTVAERGFLSITQWHQEANRCPPNILLLVAEGAPDSPERLLVTVRGGELDLETCTPEHQETFELGELPVGRWTDFLVHVRWSSDPAAGLLEVRLGGKTVLSPVPVATLYDGQFAYLKQGIYRSNTQETTRLYVAGTRRDEKESVASPPDCRDRSWRSLLSRRTAWC